ncbi:carbohydrate ABC transporter permease [Microbacterium sp. MPKO10]|uniref:carbohydrate ABC transporter permease n=1 Tax=Microbacterium sp. MPKO10 TaxID=2989818 RepID=UPI002235F53F|nr:carbohydrate ABC transporter permease [Microbacterium sp. MPKO10]MCW4457372.1 carbohydrate ABC transporter permease [Microbacterium sp. MPKO10]
MSAQSLTKTTDIPAVAPVRSRRTLGNRADGQRRIWNGVAAIAALVLVFPIYWMVNTALSENENLFSRTPRFFPFPLSLDSFAGILIDDGFWSALGMSAGVTAVVVVIAVFFGFLAAVAVSRFRFRGGGLIILLVLIVQMIPSEALFISQFRMLDDWHLLNSVGGLSILYIGTIVPFTVWLLRGFIHGIPPELEEAAMVDGCSRFGAFMRVTLPLLGPGIVTASVFSFLQAWNEYTLALVVMTKPSKATLPLWLQTFSSDLSATDWAGIMAGATLISVPVVILFLIVQGRLGAGMMAGAVKG